MRRFFSWRSTKPILQEQVVKDTLLPLLLEYTDCVLFCLSKDMVIRKLSKEAERLYAWSSDKVIGKNFIKLCRSHHVESPIPENETKLLTGWPISGVTTDLITAGFDHIEITWHIVPIASEKSNFSGWLLTGKVAPTEQTEQDLDKAVGNGAGAFHYLPAFVCWKDKSGTYRGASEAYAALVGETTETIVGQSDFEMPWDVSQATDLRKQDEFCIDNPHEIVTSDDALRTVEGGVVVLRTQRKAIVDEEGEVVGLMFVGFDVTEERKVAMDLQLAIEKERLDNQSRMNLLDNIGNDVRTPLRAMVSDAEKVANEKDIGPAQRKALADIMSKGRGSLGQLDDLIDVSKLEMARIEKTTVGFDLYQMLQNVIAPLEKASSIACEFYYRQAPNVPQYVMGDKSRLRRILSVLLNRLMVFMDDGELTLAVVFADENPHADPSIRFLIEVGGVNSRDIQVTKLAKQFSRADVPYDHALQGMGLAVSLCRRMVYALGGHIGVDEAVPTGNRFWFSLPLTVATEEAVRTGTGLPVGNTVPQFDVSVLLVEDNFLNQKVAKIALEELGCRVDIACNGTEALDYFAAKRYDLIVMDIGLPDIDGFKVTQSIRLIEETEGLVRTRILVLTAHSFLDDGAKVGNAGADDLMLKPLMTPELHERFNRWFTPVG